MSLLKIRNVILIVIVFCNLTLYSTASIVVLNGLTHESQGQPGETYRGTIQIQNTGKTEKDVRVYQKDYWFSYTGESKHDPAGTLERSNSDWIEYNPELLTLQANEVANIEFEVNIPNQDSIKGTYWSVIMVEGIKTPDTTNLNMGVKINTAIRYAVQLITNVGNSGIKDMQFLGVELAKENESNILNVAISNIGEQILRSEISIELFDESGKSAGTIKAERRKTFPGTSATATLNLEGIKPGNYSGILIADCGEDHIFGSNLSLEIE